MAQQTTNVFAAEAHPFPTYLTGIATSTHPREGVVEFESSENPQTSATPVPDSLSTDLALFRPQLLSLDSMINPILLYKYFSPSSNYAIVSQKKKICYDGIE